MKAITVLAVAALAIAVTACCPCRRSASTIPLMGTQWRLTQLGGKSIDSKNFRMTLAAEGRITGVGDCNRFNGTFLGQAPKGKTSGKIAVNDNLVSTRMMCLNQALEESFLKMLLAADSWSIDGGKLMLIGSGDVLAIFEVDPEAVKKAEEQAKK